MSQLAKFILCTLVFFTTKAYATVDYSGILPYIQEETKTPFIAFDNKVGDCMETSRYNTNFPINKWLSLLSKEKQQIILFYISNKAFYNCYQPEHKQLIDQINNNNDEFMINFLRSADHINEPIAPKLTNDEIENVELLLLQHPNPFATFKAYEAMKIKYNVIDPDEPKK